MYSCHIHNKHPAWLTDRISSGEPRGHFVASPQEVSKCSQSSRRVGNELEEPFENSHQNLPGRDPEVTDAVGGAPAEQDLSVKPGLFNKFLINVVKSEY